MAQRPIPKKEEARTIEAMRRNYSQEYENYNITAIANELGIPRSTAGSRVKNLAKKLGTPEPSSEPSEQENRTILALRDRIARLEKELKQSHRDANGWADIREGVLGLIAEPLEPVKFPKASGSQRGRATVVLHLSDLHCGEVISLQEMGGLNSFNADIFKARMGRLANTASSLMTKHWPADLPPEKIIVILGGDLISGDHREELAKTNDMMVAPGSRLCASSIAGLVLELQGIAPVDVVAVPGNHGRNTLKIESKNFSRDSFDTMICALVEMLLKDHPRVRFFYPDSGDALLHVYKTTFAVVHGHREIKGGLGFVGPFAAILRAWQKTIAYYAAQGRKVDLVLSGHMHCAGFILSMGISNGCLPGPSEYSRDLRARPEPASQNMIIVHSEKGVIDVKQIFVGDASEGRIYAEIGNEHENFVTDEWVAVLS